mmetsp:Transcript_112573/g.317967  ORF Transcript_112573/g.317967 Transcript_112573/m.317967 type:complete len:226 (+) Transcript_112573:118-795(+)
MPSYQSDQYFLRRFLIRAPGFDAELCAVAAGTASGRIPATAGLAAPEPNTTDFATGGVIAGRMTPPGRTPAMGRMDPGTAGRIPAGAGRATAAAATRAAANLAAGDAAAATGSMRGLLLGSITPALMVASGRFTPAANVGGTCGRVTTVFVTKGVPGRGEIAGRTSAVPGRTAATAPGRGDGIAAIALVAGSAASQTRLLSHCAIYCSRAAMAPTPGAVLKVWIT